jgi:hypothetical protein
MAIFKESSAVSELVEFIFIDYCGDRDIRQAIKFFA